VLALLNHEKVFTEGKFEISGGFATYNQKRVYGIEVPFGFEVQGIEVKVKKRMEWGVIDLPNTFQPYVRLRVKK